MPLSPKSNSKAGAANALTDTIQTVPGLPTKVKIFKVACSRFWWARVYLNGRYLVRSLKTEKLREAQAAAKQFFIAAIVDAEHSGKDLVSIVVHVVSCFLVSAIYLGVFTLVKRG